MNLRNNKGVTGVDVSISLVIVVLFVSIIATIIYNFAVTSKSINRKSEAIDIAIQKIENIKQINYDEISSDAEYYGENNEYTVTTEVEKYRDSEYAQNLPNEKKVNLQDIIKIVTVKVSYTTGNDTETVDISTVVTKEE